MNSLFLDGTALDCPDAADSNDDGEVDLADPIQELGYLFLHGRAPPAPGPDSCGPDPTDDGLALCGYPAANCR